MVQVLDPEKREKILETAAELFAARSFHQVRLDEIASRAHVGKGTLYTYFESKEELYFSVLYEGFAAMVDELSRELGSGQQSPLEALRTITRGVAGYALRHPHLFELTRLVGAPSKKSPDWARKRQELTGLVVQTIRRGIATGELRDAHPEWTAQLILSAVRAVVLYGGPPQDPEVLAEHLFGFLEAGLTRAGGTTDASKL